MHPMMRLTSFKTPLILFSVICLSALPGYAAELEADSHITAATVYANRATVTRTAKISVPAGAHTVIFKGLPASLMPDSLRVEGEGNHPVTLGALSQKIINQADLVRPQEQAITDQILALEDQKQMLAADIDALEIKRDFYKRLAEEAADKEQQDRKEFDLNPATWQQAAEALASGLGDAQKALVQKRIENRHIEEQLTKLHNDLKQVRTGSRQGWQVALPVEAQQSSTLTLKLSYQLPNAFWHPVYDARLNTQSGALEIVQYGAVSQHTGEDWEGIKLTLSTARPQRGASLPPLGPMWLRLFNPQVMAKSARGAAGMLADMSASDSIEYENQMRAEAALAYAQSSAPMPAQAPPPVAAEMQQAQIDTGGFTAEYRIPGPSEVKSDGTESKLLIAPFQTDSALEVHVKPQMDLNAYLVARATLKGDAPILPGTVSLFRDGAYVGQSRLPLLRPGKETDLYFGIDDQVEVTRNILKDESAETGLMNKDNSREFHVVTTIQNLRNKDVSLVLQETTPVSKDEKIEADILKDHTTQGYEKDTDDIKGLLTWKQALKPQQKTDIKLGWKVSWPKESNIQGMP